MISKSNFWQNASFVGHAQIAGKTWLLFDSSHAEHRSLEREIGIQNARFNVAMILDELDDFLDLRTEILRYCAKNPAAHIFVRDDVNDTAYVLHFYVPFREIHVITCWNQKADRTISGRMHSHFRDGLNLLVRGDTVRLLMCECGRITTVCECPNIEIGIIN